MTKIRFDKTRLVYTGCGAEVRAACVCGMAYEVLAEKREGDRQRAKTFRARKHEQKQQPRHVTPDDSFKWTDAEIIEETKPEGPRGHRATEEDYAAAIVRDVEISISNLESEVDDLDLLRELILQKLTFSLGPGGGAEANNEQHKAH
jgi:hypothetical protein